MGFGEIGSAMSMYNILATLLALMPAPRRAARAAWAPHARSYVRVASPFYPSDHELTKKSPKMSEECSEKEGKKNPENVRGMQLNESIKKRNATRGLPRRSPILVLLSPKHT